MAGTPDIEILVGVLGGGKISGESGALIQSQLASILESVRKSNAGQLKLQIDQTYLQNQIKQALQNVKLPSVSGSSGSSSKSDGSTQQTAKELKEIIALTKQINQQELKTVGRTDAQELQIINDRLSELQARKNALVQSYSAATGISEEDIQRTVQANEQVIKTLDAIALKHIAVEQQADLSYSKLEARAREYYNNISAVLARDPKMVQKFQDLLSDIEKRTDAPKKLATRFSELQAQIRKIGLETETLTQKVTRVFSEKFGYAVIAAVAMAARRALRQIYTNVVDLDTAMTELKKVTDETAATYKQFLDDAAVRAKNLGATLSDTVNATADFARLGYTLEESAQLADSALVYKNVGDGISDISDASESVISTMKAFDIAALDSMSIVDKFNEVGNNFAISSKGVGDALLNSASALAAANNDLDESIALITAANSVVQDPNKVGTALKTVSMYLRAAKTEAEEAGESTEEMAESVSELREELLSLTGGRVDIQLNENSFKSTYQIMKELSVVWDDLTDITQANILEQIGGKRNSNVVSALLSNFAIAEDVLATSQAAAGSALAENEKYLDSINGKIAQLQASYQKLSANILDSGLVKGVISAVTGLIDFLNKLDDATQGIASSVAITIAAVIALTGVIQILSEKIAMYLGVKLFAPLTEVAAGLKALFASKTLTGGFAALGASLSPLTKVVVSLTAVATAGVLIYKAYRKANPTLEDLRDHAQDLEKEFSSLKTELETNKSRIEELQALANNGTISLVEEDELKRLREENALLAEQLAYQQSLIDINQEQVQAKALKRYVQYQTERSYYVAGDPLEHYSSEAQDLEGQLNEIESLGAKLQNAIDTQNAEAIGTIKAQISEAQTAAREGIQELEEIVADFEYTPGTNLTEMQTQMNEALDFYYQMLDKSVLISQDTDAASTVMESILNRSQFASATDALRELGDAGALTYESLLELADTNPEVSLLLEYLEGLGLLDFTKTQRRISNLAAQLNALSANGNVDYQGHSVATEQQMLDAGWKTVSHEDAVVGKTVAFRGTDFDTTSDVLLESSLVVTPVLANGAVLSPEALEQYVRGLFQSEDVIAADKVGNGGLGILVNFLEDDPTGQKLSDYFADASFVNTAYTHAVDDMQDGLASLINYFQKTEEVVEDVSDQLTGLMDTVAKLTDQYDLLQTAQKEYQTNGTLTSSTLQSIIEKYPELEDNVNLYLAGLKSGKELLADMSTAYTADVENYERSLAAKLAASPQFYERLTDDQKTLIDDLAKSYKVDLDNFKDLESKKLEFQAQVIAALARNYSKYTGSTVEQLKSSLSILDDQWIISADPKMKEERDAVAKTLSAIQEMQDMVDKLTLEYTIGSFQGSDYSSTKSSSSTDKWKEAAEAEIAALKHRLEMDQITQAQYYDGLEAIENKYYKNSAANQKKYVEEIRSIDEELFDGRRELFSDWVNDQNKQAEKLSIMGDVANQQKVYTAILQETAKMIDKAYAYGLDENSDYVQELKEQFHETCQAILSMVTDTYDRFRSYAEDFGMWNRFDFTQLDVLEQELKRIQELYEDGTLGWTEYVDAYNQVAKDLYDTKQNSIETIIDLTMEMIEQEANREIDALDDQIDRLNEIIALKKKLLQDSSDEADHEREVAEAVAEIAKLQSKIAQLSLDDSRDAYAQRVALEEELAEKQRALADLQGDYALDKTLDMLDETQEAKEKEAEAEKDAIESSVDTWVKRYQLAIDRIDNDWDGLYRDLNNYMAEFRDSIDGPDSLETAWRNVNQMVQETGKNIESIYNSNNEIGINPASSSHKSAQQILDQMQANSISAKQAGTSLVGGVDLHQENMKLAQEYEALTGRRLTYNSGWRFDNGALAYDIVSAATSSSSVATNSNASGTWASKNPYTAPSSSDTIQMNSIGDKVKWVQYQLQKTTDSSLPITGQFWTATQTAVKQFQKQNGLSADGIVGAKTIAALKKYHSGGIVDGTGAINDQEVLAILRRGEVVLNDGQKKNLRVVLEGLISSATMAASMKNLTSFNRKPISSGVSETFAPTLSVTINHNGKMTDADANRYGKQVGNIALETMYETMRTRGIKG